MSEILLCTDLDRTLIPNGKEPESPGVRERISSLVAREEIVLAYVTGRSRALVEEAIEVYGLPAPGFVIGDVGSTLYDLTRGSWHASSAWTDELRRDWPRGAREELLEALSTRPELQPQEEARQGPFKISYHAPPRRGDWLDEVHRLVEKGPASRLVWSRDETRDEGLLDVLPERGGKLGAIEFLRRDRSIPRGRTIFAGDSDNDLEVLTSSIPSVLVANAADDLKRRAEALAAEKGRADTFYVARGGFRGMNGHYGAGILEGLVHYLPETAEWIA
jgi:HAD superfamily hydrolase (TIGR01484 family)